ncbi:hypothetical protein KEM52_000336 [Ascosphaera acerosa]|nr:hypothetical protein KEM52_000336 [Ascosphaera acerosa]
MAPTALSPSGERQHNIRPGDDVPRVSTVNENEGACVMLAASSSLHAVPLPPSPPPSSSSSSSSSSASSELRSSRWSLTTPPTSISESTAAVSRRSSTSTTTSNSGNNNANNSEGYGDGGLVREPPEPLVFDRFCFQDIMSVGSCSAGDAAAVFASLLDIASRGMVQLRQASNGHVFVRYCGSARRWSGEAAAAAGLVGR